VVFSWQKTGRIIHGALEPSKELRAMFGGHMQAFLREANVLDDLTENQEKITAVLRTCFPGAPGSVVVSTYALR
jgi:hypothetical protein